MQSTTTTDEGIVWELSRGNLRFRITDKPETSVVEVGGMKVEHFDLVAIADAAMHQFMEAQEFLAAASMLIATNNGETNMWPIS